MTSSLALGEVLKQIVLKSISPRTAIVSSKGAQPVATSTTKLIALGTTFSVVALYKMGGIRNMIAKLAGTIYDTMIINMTEIWYKKVLEGQPDNICILDVGIGTAGALLRCKDIIKAKNLHIIGIDYNEFYVRSARENIEKNSMGDHITVHALSIYDKEKIRSVLNENLKGKDKKIDCVYFSGSFSLLPDPKGALLVVMKELEPTKGKVYITQTYQKRTLPLMSYVKPLLKYITTVDFGQLVKTEEIIDILEGVNDDGLFLEEHNVIEGSVDNYWQAAYISVLGFGNKSSGILSGVQPTGKFWNKWFQ